MELLFGIYGRCFLAVGDILWACFIGDWTQRFWVRIGYYKFIVDSAASPRPCNFSMRLALGTEVRGKDSELHITEMQPRKKVNTRNPAGTAHLRIETYKSGELHCRVCSFFSGCQCSLAISLR